MLRWRLCVSAVLIPTIIGLFVWDSRFGASAPIFFVVCLLIGLRCGWELLGLLRVEAPRAQFLPFAACLVMLLLATWAPHWDGLGDSVRTDVFSLDKVFAGCVLLLLAVHVFRFRGPGGAARALSAEIFAVAYVGLLLCVTAQLRWLEPAGNGYLALGSLIAATKMGDIGAYTLGRLFGRRKMAPLISPGKTWMGAVGAVIGGTMGAWIWLRLAGPAWGTTWDTQLSVWGGIYGAILGVAGLIGDLCESLVKRDVGAKDAASLLPGFGGLLDLLDSILFAGPVALVLWRLFFTGLS